MAFASSEAAAVVSRPSAEHVHAISGFAPGHAELLPDFGGRAAGGQGHPAVGLASSSPQTCRTVRTLDATSLSAFLGFGLRPLGTVKAGVAPNLLFPSP